MHEFGTELTVVDDDQSQCEQEGEQDQEHQGHAGAHHDDGGGVVQPALPCVHRIAPLGPEAIAADQPEGQRGPRAHF